MEEKTKEIHEDSTGIWNLSQQSDFPFIILSSFFILK